MNTTGAINCVDFTGCPQNSSKIDDSTGILPKCTTDSNYVYNFDYLDSQFLTDFNLNGDRKPGTVNMENCADIDFQPGMIDIHSSIPGNYGLPVFSIVGLSQQLYAGNKCLVDIGQKSIDCTLDSGSPFSLIAKEMLYTIPELSKCQLHDSTTPPLFTASGEPLSILGMIRTTANFG